MSHLNLGPPPNTVESEQEAIYSSEGKSILDFNDLDIDFLKEDWDDGGEDLEFTDSGTTTLGKYTFPNRSALVVNVLDVEFKQ